MGGGVGGRGELRDSCNLLGTADLTHNPFLPPALNLLLGCEHFPRRRWEGQALLSPS